MGDVEFPSVPVLVDREGEMDRIRQALEAAGTAQARLLLIRGEAGAGKTRLVQEAATEAKRLRRLVVCGTARAESSVPYHLWAEPFGQLGLDHVLEAAPPPRLLGLYLFSVDSRPLAEIERSPNEWSNRTVDEKSLVPDADGSGKESLLGGGLTAFDRGDCRSIRLERPEFRLWATVKGREDELLLEDLRKLAKAVELGPTGVSPGTAQSFRDLLDSGKCDGIDYGKDDPKLRQSRLRQNAALGVARKAELQPLLVVLDDLQWADPSSLELLAYVARNVGQSHAFLLGTYRTEQGEVRSHLREALHRMAQENLQTELSVSGLSRRDLDRLAESFIGAHGLPDAFLDLLWNETGGNPLIIREVLRELLNENAIQLRGGHKKLAVPLGDLSIPRRVRDAMRARLDRIPKEDRRLMEAAAACGTRFTAAMVARLVGEAEGKVLNGFESIAVGHGFLRREESGFSFDHPAVQEVLYSDMAEDARCVYHREAANWLELAGGPTEDVAEHLYRAGDPRAVGRLRQAAQIARERFANAEAIRFYTEALEVTEDPETRYGILEALGSIQQLVGNYKAGLTSLASALELAKTSRERAGILARVGEMRAAIGELEGAGQACVQALPLIEGEGVAEEARVLGAMGAIRLKTGDYDAALECLGRSLAIWEKVGDRNGVAKMLNRIGNVHADKGDFDRGLEYLSRSLDIQREIGDSIGVAASLNNIGTVHYERGNYDQAIEYFGRSLAAWERVGDPSSAADPLNNLGLVHLARGDYDQALECLGRTLAIAEKLGTPLPAAAALLNIGIVHREKGDHDRALECLNRSLATFHRIGNQKGVAFAMNLIGNALRDIGDYDGALERLDASMTIQEEIGSRADVARNLIDHAELGLERGDLASAERMCERGLALAMETRDEETIARAKMAFGILFGAREAWRESSACFDESLRIFAQIGQTFLQGRTHYEFGLMWKNKGNHDKARKHLTRAAGLFERIGSRRELERTTDALRDLR